MRTTIPIALVAVALSSIALADDTPAPKGNFMSSLKQSFQQNYDREVVRAHFDIGTPPDSHRYYCLVDPKNGKAEANGVAGKPTPRRDGMTGIEGAAVSFYSCADAEAKGLLVTSDYHVTLAAGVHAVAAPAVKPAPPSGPAAATAAVVSPVPAAAPEDRSSSYSTGDPMATLVSFLGAYNSGDVASLGSLLGESTDFAWVQPNGRISWGHRAAAEAVQAAQTSGAQLLLQSQEGHPISLAPKAVILITKLRLTQKSGEPRTLRCSSVLVQTPGGWRIASLFMTPEAG